MKKMLLIMIIIASLSVMFGLDSEASDVVGYVKYEMTANDFNMIAFPMDSGLTTTAELAAAISGDVTDMSVWDNETHGWNQYLVATPGSSFDITPGDAFLVSLGGTTDVDFYCAGTLPTQANYDVTGNDFNTMMLPLNKSEITNTAEFAAAIGEGITDISTWDNETHGWKQYLVATPGSSFDISIGDGFLISSTIQYDGWNAPTAKRTIQKTSARARK